MNKQVVKFGFKRMIILAGLVGISFLSSLAATNKHGKETSSAVQYVGTTEKGIVFNVKYDNADAEKFDLDYQK